MDFGGLLAAQQQIFMKELKAGHMVPTPTEVVQLQHDGACVANDPDPDSDSDNNATFFDKLASGSKRACTGNALVLAPAHAGKRARKAPGPQVASASAKLSGTGSIHRVGALSTFVVSKRRCEVCRAVGVPAGNFVCGDACRTSPLGVELAEGRASRRADLEERRAAYRATCTECRQTALQNTRASCGVSDIEQAVDACTNTECRVWVARTWCKRRIQD